MLVMGDDWVYQSHELFNQIFADNPIESVGHSDGPEFVRGRRAF